MRQRPKTKRFRTGCRPLWAMIPLVLWAMSSQVQAELITEWKQVDANTVVAKIGGVQVRIDSSVDIFTNGIYDATDYDLKFDPGIFESLASSDAATYTLTLPSTHRFNRVAVVGIAGTGSNPVISAKGGWTLEQVSGGPPTTNVSGTDINYLSPFVASVANLGADIGPIDADILNVMNAWRRVQIRFDTQTEDDPFGFDIDIKPVDTTPVPEPAGMPIVALIGLLCYGTRQRSSRVVSFLQRRLTLHRMRNQP